MLEGEEPGAGGDWRSFDVAGDDGPGQVASMRRSEREQASVQSVDRDFLANVIGALAEDCFPNDLHFSRRILRTMRSCLPGKRSAALEEVACGESGEADTLRQHRPGNNLKSEELRTGPSLGTNSNTLPSRGKLVFVK